jgi:hypothetical protein
MYFQYFSFVYVCCVNVIECDLWICSLFFNLFLHISKFPNEYGNSLKQVDHTINFSFACFIVC